MISAGSLGRRALLSLGILAASGFVAVGPAAAGPAVQMRHLAPAGPIFSGGIALDQGGDLFEVSPSGNAVYVLPAHDGTVFGQPVTTGVEVQIEAARGLDIPSGIAFDATGDLFISNAGYADSISVLPAHDGTLFGQQVVANQAVTLAAAQGIITPMGLTFDTSGDLFVASESLGSVAVIAPSSTTIFGQQVAASTTTFLTATSSVDLGGARGLAMDAADDLFVSTASGIAVVAPTDRTVLGQTVEGDVAAMLDATSALRDDRGEILDVAVDGSGDLFALAQDNNQVVTTTVVPAAATTEVLGQTVVAGVAELLDAATVPSATASALTFAASGDLVMASTVITGMHAALSTDVIASADGTFCGTAVTAGVRTSIPFGMVISVNPFEPSQVAVDQRGNAYIASLFDQGLVVVPAVTGRLFGQDVVRGVPTVLAAAGPAVMAVAVDAGGDLVVATGAKGDVRAIVPRPTTLFGQVVDADTATPIAALGSVKRTVGLAFDPAGDLLLATSAHGLVALPAASGSLYGHPVTAGQAATIVPDLGLPIGITVDTQGHVFILTETASHQYLPSVSLLSPRTEPVLGQTVTAGELTDVASMASDSLGLYLTSLSTTAAGDLVASGTHYGDAGSDGSIVVDSAAGATLWGQDFSAGAPTDLSASRGHAGFMSVAVGAGDGLYGLSTTGLWGIGGTLAFVSPDHARVRIGRSASIRIETVGGLTVPEISLVRGLPSGMSLTDDGDGSVTLAGVPADGTAKSVVLTVSATDHVGSPVTFALTISVAAHDTLRPGRSFGVGHPLRSRNGWYTLTLNRGGNLTLRTDGGRRLWSSHTKGSGAVRLTYSKRGVVLLLDAAGHRVFRAGTRQSDPQRLRLRNSGDLVAIAAGVTTWHSDTAGPSSCSPLKPRHVC